MAGILDGKVAIITGAASGIGRATSQIFAREGAKLLLADVQEDGGNETVKMVKDAGGTAIFMKVDVSKWADVEAMVAKAVATYGRLDCAFNNAGIDGKASRTHECTEENWARVMSINLTGVWLCMKAELAQFMKQGDGGAIVNTSSDAGLIGVSGMPAYVAAKHGVAGSDQGGGARIRPPQDSRQRSLPRTDSHSDVGKIARGETGQRREDGARRTAQAPRRSVRDWRSGGLAVLGSRFICSRAADAGRWRFYGDLINPRRIAIARSKIVQ